MSDKEIVNKDGSKASIHYFVDGHCYVDSTTDKEGNKVFYDIDNTVAYIDNKDNVRASYRNGNISQIDFHNGKWLTAEEEGVYRFWQNDEKTGSPAYNVEIDKQGKVLSIEVFREDDYTLEKISLDSPEAKKIIKKTKKDREQISNVLDNFSVIKERSGNIRDKSLSNQQDNEHSGEVGPKEVSYALRTEEVKHRLGMSDSNSDLDIQQQFSDRVDARKKARTANKERVEVRKSTNIR